MSRRHRRANANAQHRSAPVTSAPRTPVAVAAPTTQPVRDRLAFERILAETAFDRAVSELVAARQTVAKQGGVTSASADARHRLALAEAALTRAASGHAASEASDEIVAEPAPKMHLISVSVAGMTCRSCEVRISKFVRRIPGVEKVTASAVHGRVEIESSTAISPSAIEAAISAAGYEVGHTPWLVRDRSIWLTAGAGVLLVVALAVVAEATGLAGLASGAGDLSQGGLVVALLLGLAAGVSTCMALVGGLVLALSASYQARRAEAGLTDGGLTAMRPALVFIAGRIAGYALFGAMLGAIGASVAMPPQVTAVMMIAVAIVMTLLGTRLTGLSPRIAAWSPTLPMGVGQRLGMGDGTAGAYSDTRAAGLGAASFFLPCGFTQAVQIYALSTGSPLFAGLLLATFAIGTAPGLLALAGLPVVVPSTARPTLLRLVGVGGHRLRRRERQRRDPAVGSDDPVFRHRVRLRSRAGGSRGRRQAVAAHLPGPQGLPPGQRHDLCRDPDDVDDRVHQYRHLCVVHPDPDPRPGRGAAQRPEHRRAAAAAGRDALVYLLDGHVQRPDHDRRSAGGGHREQLMDSRAPSPRGIIR